MGAAVISVTIGTTVAPLTRRFDTCRCHFRHVFRYGRSTIPADSSYRLCTDGADGAFQSVSAEYEQSDYMLDGLPAGTYRISSGGAFYLASGIEEFYNDQPAWQRPMMQVCHRRQKTITGIDAVLGTVQPGGISGSVTDAGGMLIGGIIVVRLLQTVGVKMKSLLRPISYLGEDRIAAPMWYSFADYDRRISPSSAKTPPR